MSEQAEFWVPEPTKAPQKAMDDAAMRFRQAVEEFNPTHIVAMVSGGDDSAAAYEMAVQIGVKIDFIIHGKTGTGIPETTTHVLDHYGNKGPDLVIADAGDAYERYVMRKGFFGVGKDAHHFAYHVLKAQPFRTAISHNIRQRRRGIRVMLINGARKTESENRKQNLQPTRLERDNLWTNIIHDWSSGDRDQFLSYAGVCRNPVAKELCRSGECMCGTQQNQGDRNEAAAIYPHWGSWLDDLEGAVRRKHGFGWGEPYPKPRDPLQGELFEDMCAECG